MTDKPKSPDDLVDEASKDPFVEHAAAGTPCGEEAEELAAMLSEDLEVQQMCAVLYMQHAARAGQLGDEVAHGVLKELAAQSHQLARKLEQLVVRSQERPS